VLAQRLAHLLEVGPWSFGRHPGRLPGDGRGETRGALLQFRR
jgi:hypothetical protein